MPVTHTNLKDVLYSTIKEPNICDPNGPVGDSTCYKCPDCHAVLSSCPEFLEHIANHLELAKPSEFFYFPDGRIFLLNELASATAGQIFIPRIRLAPYDQICDRAKVLYSNPDSSLPIISGSEVELSTIGLCQTSTTYFNAHESKAADTSHRVQSLTSKQNLPESKTLLSCTYNLEVRRGASGDEDSKETKVHERGEIVETHAFSKIKPKSLESSLRVFCTECGEFMQRDIFNGHLALHEILKKGDSQAVRKCHNCHLCNKKFMTLPGLQFHIRSHEAVEAKAIQKKFQSIYFKTSPAKFTCRNSLPKQLVKHIENNPFRRRVRGHNSFDRSYLNRPLASHNLKFSCDICGVKTATSGTLNRHKEKIHNGTGPPKVSSISKNSSRLQSTRLQGVTLPKFTHPSHILNEAMHTEIVKIQIVDTSEASAKTSKAGNKPTVEISEAGNQPTAENSKAGNELTAETSEAGNGLTAEISEAGNDPTAENVEAGNDPNADNAEAGNEPTAEKAEAGNEPTADNAEAGNEHTAENAEAGNEPNADNAEAENEHTAENAEARNDPNAENGEAGNEHTAENAVAGNERNAETSEAGNDHTDEKAKVVTDPTAENTEAQYEPTAHNTEAGNEPTAENTEAGNEPNAETSRNEDSSSKNKNLWVSEVREMPISIDFVGETIRRSCQGTRAKVKDMIKKNLDVNVGKRNPLGAPDTIVCKYCPKRVFTRCYVLKKHMRICHPSEHAQELEVKKIICAACGHQCASRKELSVHKKHAHPPISYKWYACEKCPSRYRTQDNLEYHGKQMHSSAFPVTECSRCKKRYRPDMLRNHEKRASCLRPGEKLPCKQCGEQFSARNTHTRHMRLHAGNIVA